ncbi:KDO2-lipid IV(A) lauroyltransferase [Syntrophus gentianae]|uniref:KDO2-lipid IV(A) lauroyltransferase n=1 Tax=Syntrophus gentianae TaxID=43775 RepID=A0A1H7UD04_9BACT|nr:lysophospholipid acyltransferase family protein [Syntrophus gentianae]SEL94942.1 KDO2-lipid IV(A) lauroyltransferase [Syntrophus gentianae]
MKKSLVTTVVLFLLQSIPLPVRRFVFSQLALFVYYLIPDRRLVALDNLHHAFPEKSMDELIKIAKGVYRNFGILLAEFAEIPRLNEKRVNRLMEIQGMENYYKARAKNKGVIMLTGHYGNWELMAAVFPVLLDSMTVLYRPFDNAMVENLVSWVRSSKGNRFISAKRALFAMMRCLGGKGTLGLLIDQNWARKESCFVQFFNRPACTSSGLAYLVLRTGAPVLPTFMTRQEDGRYLLQIGAELEIIDTGDMDSDIVANTQCYTSVIEGIIRQHPEQWFWIHQRWKTKPHQLRKAKN